MSPFFSLGARSGRRRSPVVRVARLAARRTPSGGRLGAAARKSDGRAEARPHQRESELVPRPKAERIQEGGLEKSSPPEPFFLKQSMNSSRKLKSEFESNQNDLKVVVLRPVKVKICPVARCLLTKQDVCKGSIEKIAG